MMRKPRKRHIEQINRVNEMLAEGKQHQDGCFPWCWEVTWHSGGTIWRAGNEGHRRNWMDAQISTIRIKSYRQPHGMSLAACTGEVPGIDSLRLPDTPGDLKGSGVGARSRRGRRRLLTNPVTVFTISDIDTNNIIKGTEYCRGKSGYHVSFEGCMNPNEARGYPCMEADLSGAHLASEMIAKMGMVSPRCWGKPILDNRNQNLGNSCYPCVFPAGQQII